MDQGTLVLALLDLYTIARLHARVSKWLKNTGWVSGRAAALSPAQKKLLCDRTPFLSKNRLAVALAKGPAWLVAAFVDELKDKQARFDEPTEKTLRTHHEAVRGLRRVISSKRARLDKFEETLQEKLAKVRAAAEATRDGDLMELERATRELAEHERALP